MMGTETRFLFETDFDNPEAIESQALIYCEEDIDAAKQEALQIARAELSSLEEKRAADLLAEMSSKFDALSAQRGEDMQSATESAVDIAIIICRKVLPTLAAQNALTEIEGHISRTLVDVHGEPRIVVRVSAENVAALQPRFESFANGFDGKIVLLADDQLSPTDCHVLWADGGSEHDVQRTWSEINKAVEQITDGGIGSMANDPAIEADQVPKAESSETSNDFNSMDTSSKAID